MEDLALRAARVAARHPSSALPLPELCRLVCGSGVSIRESVLLAALERQPGEFRIIDPWQGPWSTLSAASRDRRAPRPDAPDSPWLTLWVIHRTRKHPWTPSPHGELLSRLRETLVELGWRVDEHSPADLARWLRMVESGRQSHVRLRHAKA